MSESVIGGSVIGDSSFVAGAVVMLYLALCAGLRIREVPVRWNHAEGSKVSFFRDSLRMLLEVIALRAGRGD